MRKILLLSIGGALVVGGAAFFMMTQGKSPKGEEVTTATTTPVVSNAETTTSFSGNGSMVSLLARAENLECSVSYYAEENGTATEGSFFTSRNRLRGDFVVTGTGIGTVSSVILKDDTLFSWTEIEGEKYGMKINLSELEESKKNENSPDAREAVPLDAPVTYNCTPWLTVDGSIFEPPTDILFKDYADLMNVGMEFGTIYEGETSAGDKEIQCSLCDEVAGAGKAECRAAFACE